MPTYQYRCTECDHEFEEFQSFTDDALTVCPVCGGRLRKVFNAVGVVFKGSGFYRTDSRSDAKSAASAEASSSESGTSGSEGGSKPSAPDKKKETAPAAASSSSKTDSAA